MFDDFAGHSFWPLIRQFVISKGVEPISDGEPEDELWQKIFAAMAANGTPLSRGMTPGEIQRLLTATVVAGGGGGGLPTIMRQVANRVSLPQSKNTAAAQEKTETVHQLMVDTNGLIETWWPNWYVNFSAENAAGAAIATAGAQMTYTDRQTGNPVVANMLDVVGGTTAMTAADGDYLKGTVSIDAVAGTKIKPRERNVSVTPASGAIYSQFKSDLANGEKYEFSNSVSALATAPVQTFANTWRGPCLIRALSNKPVIAIIGDSIGDGIYYVPNTARGDGGLSPAIIGEAGGIYCSVCSRGETAQGYRASMSTSRRSDIIRASGATAILAALGINDFNGGRTAAEVFADNQAIGDYYGLPIIWSTICAFTVGGITTPWDAAKEAQRQLYNAMVRAMAVYIDPDATLCTPEGGWRSEDAVYAADYLHVLAAGGAYAAQNCAIVGTTLALHGIAPRAAGPVMPGKGTNLFVSSRSINNANWTRFAASPVGTAKSGPEWGLTSEAYLEAATTATHRFLPALPINCTTGTYEIEFDAAYLGYQWMQLQLSGANAFIAFDLLNGAGGNIFNTSPAVTAFTVGSVSPLSNGYFRFKATFTIVSAGLDIYPSFETTTGNLTGSSHPGDITKGMLLRPCFYMRKVA